MEKIKYKHTNKLIHESSPYLLQHAHNPVNWYPWGEEALSKARQENKLIIISIGYSACHWCHVMEHESFENEEIAKFMNDNFISIKVDREERPDIDQVYMNAVQLITGRGGWPLNCISLPDGRPIYGGTYFPPEQWLDMLGQVKTFVETHPKETEEQARNLTNGIREQESIYVRKDGVEFPENMLETIFNSWRGSIDKSNGGTMGAPKFPLPVSYQYLLYYHLLSGNKEASDAVYTTLDKMADGGIYDQIGGGFARYSTDAQWKVPHFEKMLYDNAQLVSLYSAAYQQTKRAAYLKVFTSTLDFIKRELSSPEGGFYSSLDADSEGVEGIFYIWKMEEIQKILGKHTAIVADYYSITSSGNWEHEKNILFRSENSSDIAKKYSLSEVELENIIEASTERLLEERGKRVRPARDEKILTSWNSLMIKGYIDAYNSSGRKEYLEIALANANFLSKNMIQKDHSILRNYKDGRASIAGFLDDYAFTISAFISIYQSTFDESWLLKAKDLSVFVKSHFYDKKSGMLFYTSDLDAELIARKMEITDNVIPSASSEMAKNLFILGTYFDTREDIELAEQMATNVKEQAGVSGPYYANWDILISWLIKKPFEVAITGPDALERRKEIATNYLPDVFLLGGTKAGTLPLLENKHIAGQTMLYVCRNKTCQLPTTEVDEALRQLGRE